MEALFAIGQIVSLRADPSRRGPVIAVLPPTASRARYRVFHSPTDTREYHEDQLATAEPASGDDDIAYTISTGTGTAPEIFRAQLTALRLAHPQIDNLYALHAARIQHIPFQFKPLLRFLRADQPRLLIADEVGVGKTIEAGLILKEMQTRQEMENVLIVCPKALVSKWQAEMRRFDEDFRPLTAESLRYCLKETHLDGVWPAQYSRAIGHLELLRSEEYLHGTEGRRGHPGLLTLDPPPRFSLLIIDEAHHLRNVDTYSHELARFLCEVSEAAVFLSATPVHVGSRNLFTLLNLLRPDLFIDETVFDEMIEPNRYLTQAMRYIRSRRPEETWQIDAAVALREAGATPWGRHVLKEDPRFTEWLQDLQRLPALTDTERIRCLGDLEELHSLSHILSRTRRRDIGRFTIRQPQTVSVAFTPQQQEFYDALLDFRRDVLLRDYNLTIVRMVLDTLERQAASCLPALIPTLDGFIRTGRFSIEELSDDIETDESSIDLPSDLVGRARSLRGLAAALPSEDPKLDRLFAIVQETMIGNGPRKLLVFSFFLHTLRYLEQQLRAAGRRVAVITGRVPDEEREYLRGRFRLPHADDDALDILLSSEVGCEGLDYEFCDRLVNYDIPWNPMRIEQRIGRIDRFGQPSDKVLIFNFITPGTVEERIFFRCFDRLGIFRDAIGDLEEVLGEVLQDLTRLALDPKLTPDQAEDKARQAADNAIRTVEEQRRLEEESGALLGLEQVAGAELDALIAEGRFVLPNDLQTMVELFLAEPGIEGRLTPDEHGSLIYRLRLRREARSLLLDRVRELERQDRPTITFTRWLSGDEPYMPLTFDQRTALEHREIAFVTPVHPLAKIALAHWAANPEPLTADLSVLDSTLPAGRYLFACDLWESLSIKPELRLVGFAWDLGRSCLAPEISAQLLRLVGGATQASAARGTMADEVRDGLQELDEEAHRQRLQALAELRERNNTLVARKLASLDAYYRNRLQRVEADLQRTDDERIVRMREAEKARIELDYDRKRTEIQGRREADIISKRVATGLLEIRHGE